MGDTAMPFAKHENKIVSGRCLWYVGFRALVLVVVVYGLIVLSTRPVLPNTSVITGYSHTKRAKDQMEQLDQAVNFADGAVLKHHRAMPPQLGHPRQVPSDPKPQQASLGGNSPLGSGPHG